MTMKAVVLYFKGMNQSYVVYLEKGNIKYKLNNK